MKLKKLYLLLLATTTLAHAENVPPAQPVPPIPPAHIDLADTVISKYLEKPRFTKTGLADFFKLQFNTSLYAQFLPRSFVHLVDFLDYATLTKKPASFVIKVFNIFDQRIKESAWVNSYALIALMDEFLVRLPNFCTATEPEDRTAQIKNELRKIYEKHKKTLRKNSDAFLEQAAQAIDAALEPAQDSFDALELQLRVTKFLEGAISKLIWNPHDQIEIWKNSCAIATKLQELYHAGIIPSTDDLNILTWALIYRLGYFIDCAGSQLNTDFFKQMIDDISHDKTQAFVLNEQEHFLLKKKQFLEEIATRGQAKSAAAGTGLYLDGIL